MFNLINIHSKDLQFLVITCDFYTDDINFKTF